MYETAAGRAVRESFLTVANKANAFSRTDELLLRQRIVAAVDELKAEGWPVERIIVRIKELASEVGIKFKSSSVNADEHPAIANAVLWCVQRFYGERLRTPE